jgi:hypothetical protein
MQDVGRGDVPIPVHVQACEPVPLRSFRRRGWSETPSAIGEDVAHHDQGVLRIDSAVQIHIEAIDRILERREIPRQQNAIFQALGRHQATHGRAVDARRAFSAADGESHDEQVERCFCS